MRLAFLLLFAPVPCWAQEIDLAATVRNISAHVERLTPILEQVRAKEWLAQGAPETYLAQQKSSLDQAKGLAQAAQALLPRPDHLPDVLQVLFRIQSLDSALGSLAEGLRKYQNPALADMLTSTEAENTANREKLQQYTLKLAVEKEQQFQTVDQEAQRCRQNLSTRPRPK
jgi:hypothetical protein